MDVPDPSAQLHDTLNTYVDEFRRHQESVKAHLRGSLVNEPLLPAFIPPSSYWTFAEKDLFFHGLCLYSRLQPDLIAQHIRTKTTFEVCVYLEALKTAAEFIEEGQHDDEDGGTNATRAEFEIAMEVSDRWIQREEAIAASLTDIDACPCSRDTRAVGIRECTCLSRSKERTDADKVIPEKRNVCLNLNHLDPTCLMVLETIYREGEGEDAQGRSEAQSSDFGVDAQANLSLRSEGSPTSETDTTSLNSQLILVSRSKSASPKPDKAQHRRLQKRLYMRRRRAEAAGKASVNLEITKLRPGRQSRDRKPSKPRPKKYQPRKRNPHGRGRRSLSEAQASQEPETDEDVEDVSRDSVAPNHNLHREEDTDPEDEESMYERHTMGGKTKPYKVKSLFLEHGINAQTVSQMDLDFFHLSTLAKLMRLNTTLNAPMRKPDASSISVDCILWLRDVVEEFVSEIIQRLITTKEQEICLKANLKVWKYAREEVKITAENVLGCLKTMGLDRFSKEIYFTEMLDAANDEESCEDMSIDEESSLLDQDKDAAGVSIDIDGVPQFTQHDSSPPLFPPSLCSLQNLTYCDLFYTTTILPADLDQGALMKELMGEDELDALDIALSKEYEMALWKAHC